MNTHLKSVPNNVSEAAIQFVAGEAQDIASIAADYNRATGHRRTTLLNTISQRLDDLLFTMLDAFHGALKPHEAGSLLAQRQPLTPQRLSSLPQDAVPLVVMRELIATHRVPIERKKLANWKLFSDRYRHAIP